jgi:hypothetical protein
MAVSQFGRLVADFKRRRPGFLPRSGHVGFLVDIIALEQVFYEYFGFPCQFSFHRLLHTHHYIAFVAGIIREIVRWTKSHSTDCSTLITI